MACLLAWGVFGVGLLGGFQADAFEKGYGEYTPGLFTEPVDVLLDEMAVQRTAGLPT